MLLRRARATLDAALLVGTTDRLTEFAHRLTSLLRWPAFGTLPRLNAAPEEAPVAMGAEDDELLAALNQIDLKLVSHARRRFVEYNSSDFPCVEVGSNVAWEHRALPYRLSMDQPLVGSGWHDRVHTPQVGWHR